MNRLCPLVLAVALLAPPVLRAAAASAADLTTERSAKAATAIRAKIEEDEKQAWETKFKPERDKEISDRWQKLVDAKIAELQERNGGRLPTQEQLDRILDPIRNDPRVIREYDEIREKWDKRLKDYSRENILPKYRKDLEGIADSERSALRAAEAPDSEFTRIAALMQAAKTDEAVREIDALVQRYPNDARLPKIRAQLAQAAQPTAQRAPEDQLEFETIQRLLVKAGEALDETTRRALLQQVLQRSEPLSRRLSGEIFLWASRASAALALDRPTEGVQAARELKRLGAVSATDAGTREIITELNIKGWWSATDADLAKQAAADSAKELAQIVREKWAGTWRRVAADNGVESTITIQGGEPLTITYRKWRSRSAPGYGSNSYYEYNYPGPIQYLLSHTSAYGTTELSGNGVGELMSPRLARGSRLLQFRISHFVDYRVSDSSIPAPPRDVINEARFYYLNPTLSGDKIVEVSFDPTGMSDQELFAKADQEFRNPKATVFERAK